MTDEVKKLPIGTTVRIPGSGILEGLIVDYPDDKDYYVIAFPSGKEYLISGRILIVKDSTKR